MVGEIKYKEKAFLFTCLYTAARNLYREAVNNFKKSTLSLSSNLCCFCEEMSNFCYAYALYYEGYMKKEDLTNVAVHGRGKAYFCLNRYFVSKLNVREK